MKQTAVEWLVENIREKGLVAALWNEKVFERAKEMEKQQIMDAHGSKLISPKGLASEYWKNGEQYYNETFNKGQ
jgi:hypothetical protein